MSDLRRIILLNGEPAQTNWFNEAVTSEPGVVQEIKPAVASLAVASGRYEYAPDELALIEQETEARIQELGKQSTESMQTLPADFPHAEKLHHAGIVSVLQLNAITDDDLLAVDGIGAKTLDAIRKAAAELIAV